MDTPVNTQVRGGGKLATTFSTSYCDIVAGQCFDLESDLANIAGCSVLLEYRPARGAREAYWLQRHARLESSRCSTWMPTIALSPRLLWVIGFPFIVWWGAVPFLSDV